MADAGGCTLESTSRASAGRPRYVKILANRCMILGFVGSSSCARWQSSRASRYRAAER